MMADYLKKNWRVILLVVFGAFMLMRLITSSYFWWIIGLVFVVCIAFAVFVYVYEIGKMPTKLLPLTRWLGFDPHYAYEKTDTTTPRQKLSRLWDRDGFINRVRRSIHIRANDGVADQVTQIADVMSSHLRKVRPDGAVTIFVGGEQGSGKTELVRAVCYVLDSFSESLVKLWGHNGVADWDDIYSNTGNGKLNIFFCDGIDKDQLNEEFFHHHKIFREGTQYSDWIIFLVVDEPLYGDDDVRSRLSAVGVDYRIASNADAVVVMDKLSPAQIGVMVNKILIQYAERSYDIRLEVQDRQNWIAFLALLAKGYGVADSSATHTFYPEVKRFFDQVVLDRNIENGSRVAVKPPEIDVKKKASSSWSELDFEILEVGYAD